MSRPSHYEPLSPTASTKPSRAEVIVLQITVVGLTGLKVPVRAPIARAHIHTFMCKQVDTTCANTRCAPVGSFPRVA